MKKTKFLALAIIGLAFASCKKDYTCECITKDSSDPSFSSTVTYSFEAKKKDADAACTAYKTTAGTLSSECKLK